MKSVSIDLYNSNTKCRSTKVILNELGYVLIKDNDSSIELDKFEVSKLLELLLNKNKI